MIYAIRAIGSGFIKFGRAKSVGKRLKELETANPHELELVAAVDWHDGAEKAIHRLLDQYWVKGEWFTECQETDEVVQWMKEGNKTSLLMVVEQEVTKGVASGELSLAHARDPVAARRAERQRWWQAKYQEKYAQERSERATLRCSNAQ